MSRLVWPAALILVALVVRAARSADPRRLDLSAELARPSGSHPFGCGEGGVDLLALSSEALLRGMALAAVVAALALAIGTSLGAWAGLRGGSTARHVQRMCDFVQAFPSFVVALGVLAAIPRPTRVHVAVVLLATAWAPFARLALSELRVVRGLQYVEAARALGAPAHRVLVRHAIPATLPVARAQLGSSASALLVADAALSFLGLGPSDGVALGALIDQGVGASLRAPHVLLVGTGALCVGALVLQAIADPKR
ncbi:MAG: ABC transporter permease subunit [Deltaproteobacteria bacterium]|nr:ABC transporter permease subunit [Deltaproteobacteria bacterium]